MKLYKVELESTLLAMIAALPLYFTGPISVFSIFFFHVVMGIIAFGFASRRPIRLSPGLLGLLGFAYLLFFPADAMLISRSLIRASAHLLFFISVYQGFEAAWKDNLGQRILVAFLIFITSIATSTHISIVVFVLLFAVLVFRELMALSARRTEEMTGAIYESVGRNRQAMGYLLPTLLIAILFFPVIPRLRNPFVQGPSSALSDQATGITEAIDLEQAQYGSDDPGVVARIWMGVDALPFFTPIRLKAAVYDLYDDGKWKSSTGRQGQVWAKDRQWVLARPEGISTKMEIQQRPTVDRQIFLPVGSYAVDDIEFLQWGSGVDQVVTPMGPRRNVTFGASVAQKVIPFSEPNIDDSGYPYDDRIRALATEVVGNGTTPREMAAKVETWMTTSFDYLENTIDRDPMTLEQFLFEERRGHCEYFAAGMVALLGSLDVPARIVGGFYGGDLNPLGRYFVMRKSDAHAWVEVYDGRTWMTYDPTPPDLRPGAGAKSALLQYLSAIQDTIIYVWDRWILTYGVSDQIEIALTALERAREAIGDLGVSLTSARLPRIPAWLIILTGMLIPAIIALQISRLRRRGIFEQLAEHLERLGHPIEPTSTGSEILASLRDRDLRVAVIATPIIRYHEIERFSGHAPPDELKFTARDALRKLKEA